MRLETELQRLPSTCSTGSISKPSPQPVTTPSHRMASLAHRTYIPPNETAKPVWNSTNFARYRAVWGLWVQQKPPNLALSDKSQSLIRSVAKYLVREY
jgi:hypothetical protein